MSIPLEPPTKDKEKFIQITIAPTTPKTWQTLVGLTASGRVFMRNIETPNDSAWVEIELPPEFTI